MDQVFRDHLPFVIGGLVLATGLFVIPRQGRSARRASTSIVALAILYPVAITVLYHVRGNLGESYAYLIYASVLGVVMAVLGLAALLTWIVATVRALRRRSST